MKQFPFLSRVQHHPLFTLVFFIAFGLVVSFVSVFAVPPATKYDPGATLDPTCAPGDTNCSVAVGDILQATSGTQNAGQIPFWTSTSRELSKSSNALYWDDLAKRFGINTSGAPDASFEVRDLGDSEDDIFRITGANSTVGDSSSVSITLGDALGDSTPSGFGFDGGGVTIQTGRGGTATGVSGTGGVGGSVNIGAQKGGHANATSSGVGGSGGTISINAGGGGNSGSNAAGAAGGGVSITGGAGSNAFAPGAVGGGISFTGGNAGSITNTGGVTASNGGGLFFFSGNGGNAPSGSINGNGGNITFQPGLGGSGLGASGQAGDIIFSTAASQGGYVGIGITNPSYLLHVKGDDGSGNIAKFETSAGATSCTLNGASGLLNCSSDERLKKNIESIGSTLSDVLALRPVSYIWQTEDENADKKYGFIAQEVEEVFPSTVNTDKDTGYKSFSSQGLIPFIVKALKELNDKVDALSGNVSNQVTQVVQSIMPSLTVGSAEAPTGITLFDKTTTEPHCLSINNGIIETTPGACQ